MKRELCDRRILGSVRCLDGVTDLPVATPLRVTAPGLTLMPGPRGLYVIHQAPGLPALQEIPNRFLDQPPTPPAGRSWPETVTLTIWEPTGRYLPRQARIQLPRGARPEQADSLFTPISIRLYPSPTAAVAPGWAVVRATVLSENAGGPPRRLPWAWLRVMRDNNGTASATPLARAQADGRGEALIAVQALPPTFEDAGRRRPDLPARIAVVFDSNLPDLPEVLTDDDPPAAEGIYRPDPDLLDGPAKHLRDGLSEPLSLLAGRTAPARVLVQLIERPP
jgi:hypothetical protein